MVGVVTNLVVALKITTTSLVQVPCPDGINGCLVAHYKEVESVKYEENKALESMPSIIVPAEELGGLYGVWCNKHIDRAHLTSCPLRLSYGSGSHKQFGSRIVGAVHYESLQKDIVEMVRKRDNECPK